MLTTRHEYGAVVAHVGVRGRGARLRRAGRACRCDRAADESRLGQPHHLADRARAARWRRSARRHARRACSRSWTARTRPGRFRSTSTRSARTSTRATATSGSAHRRAPASSGRGRSTRTGSSRSSSRGATAPRRPSPSGTAGRARAIRPPRSRCRRDRGAPHVRPRTMPPARRLLPRPPAARRADARPADVGVGAPAGRSGRAPATRSSRSTDRGRRAGVGGKEPAAGLDRALQRGGRRRAVARARSSHTRTLERLDGVLEVGADRGGDVDRPRMRRRAARVGDDGLAGGVRVPGLHRRPLVRRGEGGEHRVAGVDLGEVALDDLRARVPPSGRGSRGASGRRARSRPRGGARRRGGGTPRRTAARRGRCASRA